MLLNKKNNKLRFILKIMVDTRHSNKGLRTLRGWTQGVRTTIFKYRMVYLRFRWKSDKWLAQSNSWIALHNNNKTMQKHFVVEANNLTGSELLSIFILFEYCCSFTWKLVFIVQRWKNSRIGCRTCAVTRSLLSHSYSFSLYFSVALFDAMQKCRTFPFAAKQFHWNFVRQTALSLRLVVVVSLSVFRCRSFSFCAYPSPLSERANCDLQAQIIQRTLNRFSLCVHVQLLARTDFCEYKENGDTCIYSWVVRRCEATIITPTNFVVDNGDDGESVL